MISPVTPTADTNLVDARGRKYLTASERKDFLAAVCAHARREVTER